MRNRDQILLHLPSRIGEPMGRALPGLTTPRASIGKQLCGLWLTSDTGEAPRTAAVLRHAIVLALLFGIVDDAGSLPPALAMLPGCIGYGYLLARLIQSRRRPGTPFPHESWAGLRVTRNRTDRPAPIPLPPMRPVLHIALPIAGYLLMGR